MWGDQFRGCAAAMLPIPCGVYTALCLTTERMVLETITVWADWGTTPV